jgi:Zn-dependent metalloprotease
MAILNHMKRFSLFLLVAALLPAATFAGIASSGQRADKVRFKTYSTVTAPANLSPSNADRRAFRDFQGKVSSRWQIRYNPRTGAPSALVGGDKLHYGGEATGAARKFFSDYKSMLKIDPAQLVLQSSNTTLGLTHLLYNQYYNGIPVEGGTVKLHMDSSGNILALHSNYTPGLTLSATPRISAASAASIAAADCGGRADKPGTIVIWPSQDGTNHLSWKVGASAKGSAGGRWDYYVDAGSGAVLFRASRLKYAYNSATTPYVQGYIYPLWPLDDADWNVVSTQPISNEYVWVRGYNTVTETGSILNGTSGYYTLPVTGKIFSTLEGPYFTVTNFKHGNAHYDNGNAMWASVATDVESAHPYAPGSIYVSTVALSYASISTTCYNSSYFAQVQPHFNEIDVGSLDSGGGIDIYDELNVIDPVTGNKKGSYIGTRTSSILGAPVEGPSYVLQLDSESSGSATQQGYIVDVSSFMYLPSNTGTGCSSYDPTATNVNGSSFTWTWSQSSDNTIDEVNTFYHLNAMHDFYYSTVDNTGTAASGNRLVNLDRHLPVMVHVDEYPDQSNASNMVNAFYDQDANNILLGDGIVSSANRNLSFSLDATVIRHEYTHFVTDSMYTRIYAGESGAISEAMSDYFALSSLYDTSDTTSMAPLTGEFGAFISDEGGSGEGAGRYLDYDCTSGNDGYCCYSNNTAINGVVVASTCTSSGVSGNWDGEVHDDDNMLTRSLWRLRYNHADSNGKNYFLGLLPANSSLGITQTIPRSDFYVFNALMFYPDTFLEFRDDMVLVGKQMITLGYDTSVSTTNIATAFAIHGITETRSGGDIYEPNDGPESATDITNMASVSATIYPAYDMDFFTLPLPAGTASFKLTLPPSSTMRNEYHVMQFDMFDSSMNYVGGVMPEIVNPYGSICPNDSSISYSTECLTDSSSIVFSTSIATAGRYYLCLMAGPGEYGNSTDVSTNTYTVTRLSSSAGSGGGAVQIAMYDNDVLSFSVPYASFYTNAPVWLSTMTAQVESFHHAQLLDHNMNALADADTSVSGSYLQTVSVSTTSSAITGYLQLQPGFAARYPAVGTVYAEIYGTMRYTNVVTGVQASTQIVSLGISNPINLTSASSGEFQVWNNIFNPDKGQSCTIRYDATGGGNVSVKVFTPDGTLVRTLRDANVSEGKASFDWDGTNSNGRRVAAGMYIVHGKGPGFDNLRKVVVIR